MKTKHTNFSFSLKQTTYDKEIIQNKFSCRAASFDWTTGLSLEHGEERRVAMRPLCKLATAAVTCGCSSVCSQHGSSLLAVCVVDRWGREGGVYPLIYTGPKGSVSSGS